MQNVHALFTTRIFLTGKSSRHVRVWLCRTKVVLLTKKAVQTYLYCLPFASTMNRIGMIAASKCQYTMLSVQSTYCCVSSLLWLGKLSVLLTITLSATKNHLRGLPSFDSEQSFSSVCVCVGKVVCGLHDTHICIICPICWHVLARCFVPILGACSSELSTINLLHCKEIFVVLTLQFFLFRLIL